MSVPVGEVVLLAVALLAAGVLTGLMAGLFGIGGGAVIVPVLFQVFTTFGVPRELCMHLAVGSSLAIIIPTSIQSFRSHLAKGAVMVDVLKLWAVPVVIGVIGGSVVTAYAPGTVLKLVFIAVALANIIKIFSGRSDWHIAETLPGPAVLRGYGFGIGVLSALMGIGGGNIANLLFSFYNQPIHRAVATSSGLGVLISFPGVIGYIIAGWPYMAQLPPLSIGFMSPLAVLPSALAAMFVAPYGARLAHRLSKRALELAFASFLCIVCARFLADFLF